MFQRIPALIAAICLTIYWFWVLVKLVRLARKIGKDPNAMPRERVGQLMRLIWYPCVLVLLAALWLAVFINPACLAEGRAGVWLSLLFPPALWWFISTIPA